MISRSSSVMSRAKVARGALSLNTKVVTEHKSTSDRLLAERDSFVTAVADPRLASKHYQRIAMHSLLNIELARTLARERAQGGQEASRRSESSPRGGSRRRARRSRLARLRILIRGA